ncbi:MAG: aminomethyl-transferring glycine dehydrogenase subunit GcvPA, partial [Gaiellaceae bacterium]
MSQLSLTDDDREQMLAAIGVESVDELFREIPEGVRFQGRLNLEPALSEPELVRHLEELAARNVDTTKELSFLGAGIYDHYVPAVVDAVLQRGEFLTAYTPYQPEMSQGVLQAIFEYQTAICELTAMDVSNASGYDGTTVAADACLVAKHATGRSKIVLAETLGPQIRQVVKTYAVGFGLEVVEVPHEGGATDPAAVRAAAEDAAAVIFQQPNFFGILEDAPALAAAAKDAGALAIAHVDPVSLGVLEAPGNYGCALAIGEGQSAGNAMSYGGPHYGFLASRQDHIRRLPGRIVGET